MTTPRKPIIISRALGSNIWHVTAWPERPAKAPTLVARAWRVMARRVAPVQRQPQGVLLAWPGPKGAA